MSTRNTASPIPMASTVIRPHTAPALLLQRLAATPGWTADFASLVAELTAKQDPRALARASLTRLAARGLVELSWEPDAPATTPDSERIVHLTAEGANTLREYVPGAHIAPQRSKRLSNPAAGTTPLPRTAPNVCPRHAHNALPEHWAPQRPSSAGNTTPPLRPGATDHLRHPSRHGDRRTSYSIHT